MAKVTGPLFSMAASGALGGAIVFSSWKGRPVVRQYVVPANPQTDAQQAVRNRQRFLSQIWATMTGAAQASWEALAAAGAFSTFNAFMQRNMLLYSAGQAPSADVDHAETDTLPTMGAQSVVGGIGLATITQAVTTLAGGWGINIHRGDVEGFTPGPSNITRVVPFNGAATLVIEDTGLEPDTYFWRIIPFTVEGKLGTAGAELTAVVS